jgi:Fe-S-cluster containining protein
VLTEVSFMYETYTRNGSTYLATRENGDCVYLCAGGCSIQATKPQVCRAFDCRDYATNPGMAIRIRMQAVKRLSK